jgi:hypothetical protein
MGIDSHLSTCVGTQSPKYLEMAQGHISLSVFQWGPAQQKAFEEQKQYLIDLTTLTPPSSRAPLLLYVVASHAAVSAALVQEKQDGQTKSKHQYTSSPKYSSHQREITQNWRRYCILY